MAVRSWPLEEILFPENLDLEADLEDERYFERDLDDERYLERDLDENLPPPLPPPLPPLASINAIDDKMTAKYMRVFVFIARYSVVPVL